MTGDDPRRLYSPRLLELFARYLRRYTARTFNAVRISADGRPPPVEGPTVFYANHPAWWDPVVMLLVARACYPDLEVYAPMDEAALGRYPWLRRFGLYGIRTHSIAGTRRFLNIGRELLSEPRRALMLTAQGRFSDVRERPVVLEPGLARLLSDVPRACAVPVAIEYTFWNEKHPEVLLRFGGRATAARGRPRPAVLAELELRLEAELDALTAAAVSRDPERFDCLLEGRRGVGFWHDLPRRVRARLDGRRFDTSHAAVGRPGR